MAALYKKNEAGSPDKTSSSPVQNSPARSTIIGAPSLALNEDPFADPLDHGYGGNYEGIIFQYLIVAFRFSYLFNNYICVF